MSEKPWWWPEKIDKEWFTRIREDYPDHAHKSDEELRDYFAEGREYAVLWDHTGDAYSEYKSLADAFLSLNPNPEDFR